MADQVSWRLPEKRAARGQAARADAPRSAHAEYQPSAFFVIVLPYLGIFVYLIARGRDMGKREQQAARTRQEPLDAYIRGSAESAARAATRTSWS